MIIIGAGGAFYFVYYITAGDKCEVPKLKCVKCKEKFSMADLMMDKTTYDILISMENWGSRWHSFSCLTH